MIWFAISASAVAVAVAAIWVAVGQMRETRKWRRKYRAAEAEAERRAHIIKRMEEVARETAEKKKKLHTGSNRDRFDASLDVLSDGAGGAPRSGDHD